MSGAGKIGAGSGSTRTSGAGAVGAGDRRSKARPDELLFKELGWDRLLEPEAENYQAITAALLRDVPPEVASSRMAALQKIKDRLSARASDGRSLGQILAERARDPALVHDVAVVVGHLSGDVPIIQGKDTVACAAAVLQKMLAKDLPAEYARVALDLVADGQTKVGKKTFAVPDALSDAAGRSGVSLAFQETFLRAFDGGKGGVQSKKLDALYKSFKLKSLVSFDKGGTLRALNSGKPVAVVLRNPDGMLHSVLAQKTPEGEFYYDPARGGERYPLDRSKIGGEVSYAAATLKILREEPKTISYKTAGLIKEVISAGVGLRGVEELSPEAQARLKEAAAAYNEYLPQDPVGDGMGGVSGAEEAGSWAPPPSYVIVKKASRYVPRGRVARDNG